jgi:hypothetical protein
MKNMKKLPLKISYFSLIEEIFPYWPGCNQIRVVAFDVPQLTQASFSQKNRTLQNVFLISVTLRWHRASVACKNQKF